MLLRSIRRRSHPLHARLYCRSFGDQSRPFPAPFPTRPILEDDKDPSNLALDTSPILTDHIDTMASPLLNDTNPLDLDPVHDTTMPSLYRLHHFDTYRLLQSLEQQGFTRPQAEVVMKGIKFKLRESTAQLRKQLLLRSDLENESYLFKAELSELRTEIQIMRRNDTQMLQTDAGIVTREVEVLAQRLREDVATMKNDVTLDMNNRKNETQEEQKAIDMKIQEINNKFTVQMGEVRTELEAVRWETIWKGMAGIAAAGLGIATLGYLLTRFADRQAEVALAEKLKRKKLLKEEARQSGTADMEMLCRTSSPGSFSSSLIALQTTIQSSSSSSSPYEERHEALSIHPSFVIPLSETNLNLHKSHFPSSRETKLEHVEAFIQHQRTLLKRDQELRLATMAEIQSMIPLDTSAHDGLIRDETPLSPDPPLRSRSTPLQKRHSIFSAFEGKKRWPEVLSFKRPSFRQKVDPAVKEREVMMPLVDGLVAFRYPKMVRMNRLQVMPVQEEEEEEEEEEEDSLYKYSKRYRMHSKRFSDPGSGLSAPPFPIGRPLSSFYS